MTPWHPTINPGWADKLDDPNQFRLKSDISPLEAEQMVDRHIARLEAHTVIPAAPLMALPPLRALTDDDWTPELLAVQLELDKTNQSLACLNEEGAGVNFRAFVVPAPYLLFEVAAAGSTYKVPYDDVEMENDDLPQLRVLGIPIQGMNDIMRQQVRPLAPLSRQVRRHAQRMADKRRKRA